MPYNKISIDMDLYNLFGILKIFENPTFGENWTTFGCVFCRVYHYTNNIWIFKIESASLQEIFKYPFNSIQAQMNKQSDWRVHNKPSKHFIIHILRIHYMYAHAAANLNLTILKLLESKACALFLHVENLAQGLRVRERPVGLTHVRKSLNTFAKRFISI